MKYKKALVLNVKQCLGGSFWISKSIIYVSQGSAPLQDWNWKFKGLKQLQPRYKTVYKIRSNGSIVYNLNLLSSPYEKKAFGWQLLLRTIYRKVKFKVAAALPTQLRVWLRMWWSHKSALEISYTDWTINPKKGLTCVILYLSPSIHLDNCQIQHTKYIWQFNHPNVSNTNQHSTPGR